MNRVIWFAASVLASIALAVTYIALWIDAHRESPFPGGHYCPACDAEAQQAGA